ncbi:MAG TPA: alpha/beta hydrolase [Candidatus Acidoferrum sp.]|nr:alpha/beta hydrolase [Candidatus Acidoferrum sp.]
MVKLGETLVQQSLITQDQLAKASEFQKKSGKSLDGSLVALGFVTDDDIAGVLSRAYGVASVNLRYFEFDPQVIKLIPQDTAVRHQLIPLARVGSLLTIAMADPSNVFAMDDVRFITGFNVEAVVASEGAIAEAIEKYYGLSYESSIAKASEQTWSLDSVSSSLEDIEAALKRTEETLEVLKEKRLEFIQTADRPSSGAVIQNYAVVKIFYATDRQRTGKNSPSRFYSGNRAENEELSFGVAEVSIPRDHRMGELESPSIWKLEFRAIPERHVVLLSISQEKSDTFFEHVSNRVNSSQRKEAFVFVHGYNVTFSQGVRRTAQLAYDLAFDGPAILYSWPSVGKFLGYTVDEANVEWTAAHLTHFLELLTARTGVTTLHLIGHSMGNRAITNALRIVSDHRQAGSGRRFRQIILTAPDIDSGVFRQLSEAVSLAGDRVTLYASSMDEALAASKVFHGYPRAGESGENIVVVNGIDTVDASAVNTSLLGHSYYSENRSVLSDIFRLVRDGAPPSDRFGLTLIKHGDMNYWAFRP